MASDIGERMNAFIGAEEIAGADPALVEFMHKELTFV